MIIRKGSIREAVQVSKQIPELDCPYPIEEYQKRRNQIPHLILVTEDIRGALVGFKVGYQKGSAFYSWMGGLVPAFQQQGLATKMAVKQ